MELSFQRIDPSSDLAEHVMNYWFMKGDGAAAMPEGHRILPDGCMEFVFQLGDVFRERGVDGRFRDQLHCLFVGQMERRVDVKPKGVIRTVGVHFHPAGAAAFVAGDLGRFVNRISSLERALGEGLTRVTTRLKTASSPEHQVQILETFLRGRRGAGDPTIAKAAKALASGSGTIDLLTAARDCGLSERQFRRRFECAVGLTPKRFSRLVRFQRVFEERNESDGRAWSQVALDCGYYDQAHFNRDFRAFTGVRPRDLVHDADPLTKFFLSVSSKTRRPAAD